MPHDAFLNKIHTNSNNPNIICVLPFAINIYLSLEKNIPGSNL